MSISTIIIGKNKENREGKILELISDPKFSLKGNPDLLVIERVKNKKSIGIEEVREIGKFLKILPISHTQKIVLIREASTLTPEAQNSLLKNLEEPPEYARIILETESREKFLPTIVSRCQIIESEQTSESDVVSINFWEMNLNDRFEWAEKTSKLEKEDIIKILNLILLDIKKSLEKPSKESVNLLLEVTENLSRYNLNTRLALEYLSLNFEKKDNKI
jgi:DNA polymerase III delta prime subunit